MAVQYFIVNFIRSAASRLDKESGDKRCVYVGSARTSYIDNVFLSETNVKAFFITWLFLVVVRVCNRQLSTSHPTLEILLARINPIFSLFSIYPLHVLLLLAEDIFHTHYF
jgi:hypothetical protein